jgi:hypothetical protein
MPRRTLSIGLIALAALGSVASAQPVEPDTRPATQPATSDFSLTIYSTADPATFDPQGRERQRRYYGQEQPLPGYGVVRQTRKIDLKQGTNTVSITDVASGIDPTTVSFRSLTAPDAAAVLEQNYEYDVVSSDKLLEKYLGKTVNATRKPEGARTAEETISGTLLSTDGGNLVIQNLNGGQVSILSRGDLSSINLSRQRGGLITKPTLVWKVEADNTAAHDAQITYQTDGITWRADYNVLVSKDDAKAELGAWVSILNESGASYPNAKLKLVAGDVQRIRKDEPGAGGQSLFGGDARAMKADTGFKEKSFFEYHLYTLGRPTSLADRSTKQIELFPTRTNIPVTKTFVYYGLAPQWRYWISDQPSEDRNLGTQSNKQVDIYLRMKNSEQNGLGIPLPAGRLRVYKQDEADATNEFIGEDVISHTPKDEEVLVKLGSAFDIVGERKQTNFTVDSDGHVMTESFEIALRNHKKEPVSVIVKENLFRWFNWEITQSSDKWGKQDYRTIHIPVQVAPDGEKKVTYTVKYTW